MWTKLRVRVKERWYTVEVGDVSSTPVRVVVDDDPVEVYLEPLADDAAPYSPVEAPTNESLDWEAPTAASAAAAKVLSSPMPGVIVSVAVQVGDRLVTGDEVCILEAMKMQQVLRADWTGIVKAVYVRPGQQVLDGDRIVELE